MTLDWLLLVRSTSLCNRVRKLESSRTSKEKSNFQRRRGRMKLAKLFREKALLKSEGGGSYRGGQFGAEHTQRKMRAQTRGRGRQARSFYRREEKTQGEDYSFYL